MTDSAEYSRYPYFSVERRGAVLVATLDRPEQLNAMRLEDHAQIGRFLRAVGDDDAVDVLVLRGAGTAFCVGGDYSMVRAIVDDPRRLLSVQREARELVQAQVDLEKPVVAAVHGQTSGAGAALALLSDIIVVERGSRIGDCHTAFAMAAGDGGVLAWPLAIGLVRAKRYLLTGDYIDAEEAERLGLVTEVVEQGSGTDRALEWADRLSAMNGAAVRLTKRALNSWLRMGLGAGFESGLGYEMLTLAQPETAERVRAGLRSPRSTAG